MVVAEHALAHAAEVALHGVFHVPQGVPPKSPVAARLPALPPVHPRGGLWHIVICGARPPSEMHSHKMWCLCHRSKRWPKHEMN